MKTKISGFIIPKRKGYYPVEVPKGIKAYDPRGFLDVEYSDEQATDIENKLKAAWDKSSSSTPETKEEV